MGGRGGKSLAVCEGKGLGGGRRLCLDSFFLIF